VQTPKTIALEEHYLPDYLADYWEPTVAGMAPSLYETIKRRLTHPQSDRLADMDAAGIDQMVLSVAGPGVQAERSAALAIELAKRANDDLAKMIAHDQTRFSGFAHLPMQDPKSAADELERCVSELGFVGALVNGHTHGVYLDHANLDVFWERAAGLKVPVYIHPTDPHKKYIALEDQPMLRRPAWEWTVETATHALRLVFNGVFDRHPDAHIILGHMGETLPYLLWRFDSRSKFLRDPSDNSPLPSDIIRKHISVTISGMLDAAPLNCAIAALGDTNIMFGADYPFEEPEPAIEFIRAVDIPDATRAKIMHGNAERLLRLAR
jgi:2,3-dihydroxybenzoate decarboxylase